MTILKNTVTLFVIFLIVSFNTTTSDAENNRFEQAKRQLKDGIRTYDEELLQDAKEVFIQLADNNPSDYVYAYYAALTYLSLCDLKNFEITKSTVKADKKRLKTKRISMAEEGLNNADRSIELNNDFSDSHRVKGTLFSNMISGMFSGIRYGGMAEDEINIALKIEPNNALAKIEVAREYINKPGLLGGNVKKGIEILEKILKDNPEKEKGYVSLGIAYEEIGEKEKAINTFEHLLNINPENIEAKYNLDRLVSSK